MPTYRRPKSTQPSRKLQKKIDAAATAKRSQARAVPPGERLIDPGDVLVDITWLMEQMHCSRTLIFRMVKAGTFPKPLKIGARTRWRVRDYLAWLDRNAMCAQTAPVQQAAL
jgi:predicted DNA-binding transcriptional regulator AlpA